jgi:hypothetical protein
MEKLLQGEATCKSFFFFALVHSFQLPFLSIFNLYQNICFRVEELRDSTAHAEMICIREASKLLNSWRLSVSFPGFKFKV